MHGTDRPHCSPASGARESLALCTCATRGPEQAAGSQVQATNRVAGQSAIPATRAGTGQQVVLNSIHGACVFFASLCSWPCPYVACWLLSVEDFEH
ncbi:uncharacterized protein LOC100277748 [Zea mays]|uniref:Uncharacterized protein n=1 Tax=Zea mays TaxID=4577 RepID=B6TZK0_MAIZE|nr:uncharacterized protein LOC100277748 [Zea mays]ACG42533.1 hypothetical protein [Zea mays]|eukprot:NP_001144711.1 uncharacterized protein LOC100277748 [Zea mays]